MLMCHFLLVLEIALVKDLPLWKRRRFYHTCWEGKSQQICDTKIFKNFWFKFSISNHIQQKMMPTSATKCLFKTRLRLVCHHFSLNIYFGFRNHTVIPQYYFVLQAEFYISRSKDKANHWNYHKTLSRSELNDLEERLIYQKTCFYPFKPYG